MNSHMFIPVTSQTPPPNAQDMMVSPMTRPLVYSTNGSAPAFSYYIQSSSTSSLAPATPDSLTAFDESCSTSAYPPQHCHDISRPQSAIDLSNGYLIQHIHSNPESTNTSPLMHNSLSLDPLSQQASPLLLSQQHPQQLQPQQLQQQQQQPQPQQPQQQSPQQEQSYHVEQCSESLAYSSNIPSTSSTNSSTLENDPYFIPVQGVLPPSKNLDGRYECQLCERSYTHAKHLKRHMMRHTGLKPYGCSWCSARFTRPDIRKRHVSKCKVRRKMEGLDSIKIEEENPAKMISLKNKKMNESKQRKAAAAAAAAAAVSASAPTTASTGTTTPAKKPVKKESNSIKAKSPSRVSKSTGSSPSTTSVLYSSPQFSNSYLNLGSISAMQTPIQESLALPSATITPPPPLSSTSIPAEFDPSVLEASIKKELESNDTFYNTAPTNSNSNASHQTVYFRAMPTPSVMPSSVLPAPPHGAASVGSNIVGYMTPASPYYMAPTNYGIGVFYGQGQDSINMLTPVQYGLSNQQRMFASAESVVPTVCNGLYGESPLETFVPPHMQ